MSAFTTPLQLEYLDGHDYRLLTEFDFASEEAERIIRVPAGFVTDFASIPRFFWRVLPPTGLYGKAAVIHDYLYRSHEVSKEVADKVFREGMLVLNVPRWKAETMYLAVRLFGGQPYANGRLDPLPPT